MISIIFGKKETDYKKEQSGGRARKFIHGLKIFLSCSNSINSSLYK